MSVRHPSSLRRWVLVALAALALLVAPFGTGVARAEDGYRFWGFYQVDNGQWAFAQGSPGTTDPADGSVQGWRYAVAGMTTSRPPRTGPDFNGICGKVHPVDGQKRVAVVIDPGTAEDAPRGSAPGTVTATCVVAPTTATATQVLQTATTVRADSAGMICGVAGYPANGCGDPVADINVPATDPGVVAELTAPAGNVAKGTPVWAWIVVGGIVVVLAGAGIVVARKRRTA
ncbi:SCO2322 family protein [Raineyella sp.]|uniref:SCO2322 family protein n=1 Tax=Raineyella sp. TaxID=1911550 RepID=UPI002B217926|nr:SCO2322 family protein [Raineyella sp.]MEA5154867.1 SCO2322 family protein [Raineyella sp.]